MGLGSFLRGLLPGTGSPTAAGPSPAGPSSPAMPRGAPAADAAGRASGSWRSVPAIQRSVGAAPLVAPTAPFKAGLAAAKAAPIALAPLRHERGLHAPAGLVSGIVTPVQRATDPVPASVRRPAGAGRSVTAAAAAPAGAWPLSDTSAPEGTAWPAFGSGAVADPEPAPLLRAPAVTAVPGASPLTRASLASLVPGGRVGSHPTVARQAEASARQAEVSARQAAASARQGETFLPTFVAPATLLPRGDGSSPATGSPAAAQSLSTAPVSPSGPAAASAGLAVSRSLDTARPNLGQSRRLRVGAAITPVSGAPLGLQRSAASLAADGVDAGSHLADLPPPVRPGATSTSVAAAGRPVARELDGTAAVAGLGEAGSGGASAMAAPIGAAPAAPAAGAPEAGSAAHAAPVGAADAGSAVPLRPLTVARSADVPLVGTLQPRSSPASPAVAVHVQAEAAGEPAEAEGSPAAALAALTRIDQSAGIGQPGPGFGTAFGAPSALFPGAGASAGGRAAGTGLGSAGGSPAVARSIALPSGPAQGPAFGRGSARAQGPAFGLAARTSAPAGGRMITRSRAPGASPMPAPALQRTMTWDPVNGMTTSADPAPESGPAGAGPVASGAPAPVASGAPMPGPAAGHPALPAIAPLVARSLDSGEAPSFAAVQREEAAAAAPAGDGGGGAAPVGGGAMPEAQLDDLARRLHDKITARLSRDLLVERERAGSLIDRGW